MLREYEQMFDAAFIEEFKAMQLVSMDKLNMIINKKPPKKVIEEFLDFIETTSEGKSPIL